MAANKEMSKLKENEHLMGFQKVQDCRDRKKGREQKQKRKVKKTLELE